MRRKDIHMTNNAHPDFHRVQESTTVSELAFLCVVRDVLEKYGGSMNLDEKHNIILGIPQSKKAECFAELNGVIASLPKTV
jgi:hypothetical protein